MSRTYRVVLELTADESDRLLGLEEIRNSVANHIEEYFGTTYETFGWDEVSALVTQIKVDGRRFDPTTRTIQESLITQEIADLIADGRVIQAIKELRTLNPGMGLGEAKNHVDKYRGL